MLVGYRPGPVVHDCQIERLVAPEAAMPLSPQYIRGAFDRLWDEVDRPSGTPSRSAGRSREG